MYSTNSFCTVVEVLAFLSVFLDFSDCFHTEKRNALLIVGNTKVYNSLLQVGPLHGIRPRPLSVGQLYFSKNSLWEISCSINLRQSGRMMFRLDELSTCHSYQNTACPLKVGVLVS